MVDVSNYIFNLESLRAAVDAKETERNNCDPVFLKLEEEISFNIPPEICRIFDNVEIVNELSDVFLGYELLAKEEIISYYNQREMGLGFFGKYGADEQFNVHEGKFVAIQENLEEELASQIEVTNIARFFPLFSFQGDYIVVDLEPSNFGELIVITYTHIGTILAPSLFDHLDDLISGLISGHYKVIDDDIVYPSSWFQRQKVISGEFKMDDDGEILD
jgi:hypothetical protein